MKYDRLTKRLYGAVAIEDKFGHLVSPYDETICNALYRLSELEDKIENGTLIELPCKVGNTIWVIYQYGDCFGKVDEPFIEKDTAKFFVYDDNKMKIVPSNYGERSDYWYRVLDIFLTREEAEKRLKEIQE